VAVLKSRSDLQALQEAGHIAAEVCDALMALCVPGTCIETLEVEANRLLAMRRSTAPFKRFEGFGHAICVSINDAVVNGPPNRPERLNAGDLVSIALGSEYRGLHGKCARTVWVAESPQTLPPEPIARLLQGVRQVFAQILEAPTGFETVNDLCAAIAHSAQVHHLQLLAELGGAGIGKQLHQPPHVPNDPAALEGALLPLVPGLAFTLMPMMSLGDTPKTVQDDDGWTIRTADGALAAHWAETVLVTADGLRILTVPRG
jgi:methionyl aminopeptidase